MPPAEPLDGAGKAFLFSVLLQQNIQLMALTRRAVCCTMSKMAYTPTDDELRQALPDVRYEMRQLLYMAECLAFKHDTPPEYIRNAVLESALLHVRNLLDFFYNEKRIRDDVLATDFSFVLLRPGANVVDLKKRLHKTLAHLTYSRICYSANRDWRLPEILDPVIQECGEFARHIFSKPQLLERDEVQVWQEIEFKCKQVVK